MNVNEYGVPMVADFGGLSAVNAGASGFGSTRIVIGSVVASWPTPFDARTTKVDFPALVGVPESTPAGVNVNPAGRSPSTENVGDGSRLQ